MTSWFARETRGFALGVRQTSVPIGGFAAALGIPAIADQWGARAALLVLAGFSLSPPVSARPGSSRGRPEPASDETADALRQPLRDRRIWRLSFGSSALIATQVAVTGFVVVFLESQRGLQPPSRPGSCSPR